MEGSDLHLHNLAQIDLERARPCVWPKCALSFNLMCFYQVSEAFASTRKTASVSFHISAWTVWTYDSHVFIILVFGSFLASSKLSFHTEQLLLTTGALRRQKTNFYLPFYEENSSFLNSCLIWLHLRWRKFPARRPPFSFQCVWLRVYMKVRPILQNAIFASIPSSWKCSALRFDLCNGSALLLKLKVLRFQDRVAGM